MDDLPVWEERYLDPPDDTGDMWRRCTACGSDMPLYSYTPFRHRMDCPYAQEAPASPFPSRHSG
jgi:hypothetical protein